MGGDLFESGLLTGLGNGQVNLPKILNLRTFIKIRFLIIYFAFFALNALYRF